MSRPTTHPTPLTGHTLDPAQTRAALRSLRPELVDRYDAALPGARAAILSRLLGALGREPLPGVEAHAKAGPGPGAQYDRVVLTDGRAVDFPTAAGRPFAVTTTGLAARIDGVACDDPGTLVRTVWTPQASIAGPSRFAVEVDNSVANLALARATSSTNEADGGHEVTAARDGGLGWVEQGVVDGHPLHPCCRTRGGMSVADVLAYAPEHRPVIRLRRLRVPEDRWYGDAPPVLYAHPWQAERLRDAYPWLTDDGETGPVRPLMSLRTVAPLDGGDHVKTAVDVQMTSAVRTVSPAAVHNGPRLSALLQRLTTDLPLGVLGETSAGAVIVDGVPQRRLAYLRRDAPRVGPGEIVVPLAALGVVLDGTVDDPYAWWRQLSLILWPALLTVLERGVALEAHGQNTLVVLGGGRPVRILYRDFGGVRVSAARLRAAGVQPPPLRGDLPSDDPLVLRTKLAAAALGTVAGELVTLLERRRGADPERLWRIVAAVIHGTGTRDAAALLRDPLPIKATTAMRLAAEPLDDIWAYLDNPMAAYA